jgi:heparanase
VINTSRSASWSIELPIASERATLHSSDLESKTVALNGKTLGLGDNDTLPDMAGTPTPAGVVALEPLSITFLAVAKAANPACR